MAVEAGTLLARLVDFRRPLVRLDLPPEVCRAGPPRQVGLLTLTLPPPALRGTRNQPEAAPSPSPVLATLRGTAPQVDLASQYTSCWYEAIRQSGEPNRHDGRAWRPGLLVKALLTVPGVEPQSRVGVLDTALLYHQGRALVYVRLDAGRYERREVQVLGRDGKRWILASGVRAGEAVVFEQAQILLSQEFNTDND
jgi:hypothetical protein